MWSATAASPTAASGSIPTTTKRRSPASIAHCRRIGTAKLGIQLAHAGRKASSQRPWEGGGRSSRDADPWETIAPSAIPFGPDWHMPREASAGRHRAREQAFVEGGEAGGAYRFRP